MKKLVAVLAIAGSLVACNSNSETTTSGDSTTVKTEETQLTTPSTVDSSTVQAPLDSTAVEPLVDTTKR
jgi:uncharacterized protein YcfL